MAFHEKVKPLWDRSTLTLAQLADLCNISESSACRYITGKTTPPADIAEKMLIVLEEPVPPKGGQDPASMVQQIREIYEAQIALLRAEHTSQLASLRRDKLFLFFAAMTMFTAMVYFCIDALQGNWGLIQY